MAFLLFVDVFLVVVKGATDKLVPASMIQNKTIFELNGNVINAVISGAGGFAKSISIANALMASKSA